MSGPIVAVFKPTSPPTVPTPDAVWEGLAATKVDFSFTVPSFIEELSTIDNEGESVLKSMFSAMGSGSREGPSFEEQTWCCR